ncbi:MAG TPA: DNA polymerase III subunit delta [Aggregatilineales bacterium]|nr:DNA polymerase III subunit delta [Aggregatilineales bacterium]HPV08152.1 DNA polymerase III subunit delta [Aggregatilineales bacterium]HQA68278.1 DNA polymerase III subunit delta [Aggregatilineales bacterium]HQE17389.1 DNA polymerase III subunit delta [Aggregatilineales bacterium]
MRSPESIAFVFHGQDEPSLRDRLAKFYEKFSSPATADLNITRIDGETIQSGDIEMAAGALPFLADYRVIVVENLTASATGREVIDRLPDVLASLPDTTRIAFVETGLQSGGSQAAARGRALKKLINAVENYPRGAVLSFDLPVEKERPQWIQRRAKRYGAEIDSRAAHELAQRIGEDLTLADTELLKLATYAGDRAITVEDVAELTPYSPEAGIFDMVDALGKRQGQRALSLLERLLEEGQEPLGIFGMIIRQYRLLIQMKEQLGRGQTSQSAARAIGMHPYVAEKISEQARYYSMEQLERIYRSLLDFDLEIKTGQIEPKLALERLVTWLAG